MSPAESSETARDFAGRLAAAISASGKTRSRVERQAGLGRGRIQRLLGMGSKPILSPGPDVIRKLADELGIQYEWLAIGRGPMRRGDAAASSFEQAQEICTRVGTRPDAIEEVARRFRDEARELTVIDWIVEIDAAVRRLERAGVPRPEEVESMQRKVRRLGSRKARLLREHASVEERRGNPKDETKRPTRKRGGAT